MNTEVRSQVHQVLLSRRQAIADDWYKAISRTSFAPLKAVEVRQRLVELTEDLIALLLTEPLDRGQVEGIGASLARFHYLEPEALGGTQEVLAQRLIEGLTADQIVELQPGLTALLGGLATGFSRQACETVLAEQEWIHGALARELQRIEEVLREAYDEVEQQVQERTAELRVTNELLQREIVERELAEQALREAHHQLETRVQERTTELAKANEALRAEIAERKRAEEELIRLSSAVKSSVDSIVIIDVEGKVIDVNEAALKMYGADDEQGLIGQNVLAFIAPEHREKGRAGMEFVLEKGHDMSRGYEVITRDGNRTPVELSATAMKDADGKSSGIVIIARDITERKRAEDQLLAYQERLQSLASELSLAEERERRRIARDLHDRIGQTLAICKIKLGALRASASSTELAEPLDEIHELIDEIIQETRSLTFEVSSPILYELGLEAAVEWLVEQIQEQHGLLSHFEDDRQPKPLDDDVRVLLFQAVRELLTNVAKHAQAHNVKVSLRREDSNIKITVEDDGNGFDTSDVVSHWSRAEGFGLFSIRERLGHFGGRLEVESKPGHGTWVTLAAPLKRNEAITREE
jgi:PAS domain S-box-containing protein